MKEPWFLRGIRIRGGWGFAPTTTYTVLSSGQGAFFITLLRPPATPDHSPVQPWHAADHGDCGPNERPAKDEIG